MKNNENFSIQMYNILKEVFEIYINIINYNTGCEKDMTNILPVELKGNIFLEINDDYSGIVIKKKIEKDIITIIIVNDIIKNRYDVHLITGYNKREDLFRITKYEIIYPPFKYSKESADKLYNKLLNILKESLNQYKDIFNKLTQLKKNNIENMINIFCL